MQRCAAKCRRPSVQRLSEHAQETPRLQAGGDVLWSDQTTLGRTGPLLHRPRGFTLWGRAGLSEIGTTAH